MLTTLFMLLVGGGLAFTCLTYLFFIYEAVNDPQAMGRLPGAYDPLTPADFLRGLASSFTSIILVLICFPLGLARGLRRPGAAAGRGRPPVLLVHGLYHNAGAWPLFSHRLRRAGWRRVYRWSYSSFGEDFERIADGLKDAVRTASRESGGAPVALIGHSLGGVLIRRVLADPQCAAMVLSAVTLGSPHQGSKLAALALGRLGRQLLTPGPLADTAPAPRDLPKLSLYSPLDNLVLPNQALLVREPGWTQEQTPAMSHVGMLYHPWVASRVVKFLDAVKP